MHCYSHDPPRNRNNLHSNRHTCSIHWAMRMLFWVAPPAMNAGLCSSVSSWMDWEDGLLSTRKDVMQGIRWRAHAGPRS